MKNEIQQLFEAREEVGSGQTGMELTCVHPTGSDLDQSRPEALGSSPRAPQAEPSCSSHFIPAPLLSCVWHSVVASPWHPCPPVSRVPMWAVSTGQVDKCARDGGVPVGEPSCHRTTEPGLVLQGCPGLEGA